MKLRTTGGSPLAVFLVFLVLVAWATPSPVNGQDVRARDLGVSHGILPSAPLNADTHSVGVVRDATIEWMLEHRGDFGYALPVVAETFGSPLNDVNGFHVQREHVFEALEAATGGPVPEGNVGGGTGMVCFNFKGGIGTASRELPETHPGYCCDLSRQLFRIGTSLPPFAGRGYFSGTTALTS